MELVVFDLDDTLLNRESAISDYTSETLRLLTERDIAYTVATGRTLHGARAILDGHHFPLPQAYKNGVMIWHPDTERFSSGATLTARELDNVVGACLSHGLTPFVFTLDDDDGSTVYHSPTLTDVERELIRSIGIEEAVGDGDAVQSVLRSVRDEPHLVAYSGFALEGQQWRWLDVHHSDASKGGAIEIMKRLLGVESVICFGDSDNDMSMFAAADECYAPANANERIKSAATAVIGHHDDEGIARFLRERFELGG